MFSIMKSTFRLKCKEKPKLSLPRDPLHFKDWIGGLEFSENLNINDPITVNTNFTIAIVRYEYANLYWTIMDLYDTYLVMSFFKKTPAETTILLVDAHPASHLDPLWYHIFGSVHRLSEMPSLMQYQHLVWEFPRTNSPLLLKSSEVPAVQEFKKTVWSRMGFTTHVPVCTPEKKLNILMIWRRNYVAHPRNPSGNKNNIIL